MAGRHRAPSKTGKRVATVAAMTAIGGIATSAMGVSTASAADDFDHDAVISCESGGDATAQNSHSTASGLYQFVNGTWAHYGGLKYAPTAAQATPAQQREIANRAFAAEGYSPWAASKGCWSGKVGSGTKVEVKNDKPKVEKRTPAKKNLLDCDDFDSQYAAQLKFSADKSDPNRLDADKDGVACEDFAYKPVKTDRKPVQTTAVETYQALPVVTPRVRPQGSFTPGGTGNYVVKSGDTLSQLAFDNKTSVDTLMDRNKDIIEHRDWIFVGERLHVAP